MNIQQAIKSGKRIRRSSWGVARFSVFSEFNNLIEADILADDLEVEPVAVTITPEQFWDAYSLFLVNEGAGSKTFVRSYYARLILHMAKQLGLGKEK